MNLIRLQSVRDYVKKVPESVVALSKDQILELLTIAELAHTFISAEWIEDEQIALAKLKELLK